MKKNSQKGKSTNWKQTCNRMIAFLDILGFKNWVARENHDTVYRKLLQLTNISNDITKSRNLYIARFSDSMIIVSKDDSDICRWEFCNSIECLFANCIINDIPIKGAVSHGDITINKKQSIIFGQPLIDAFELEEELKYYGIVCHHSAQNILCNDKSNFLFETKTPFKFGTVTHYNLDWFSMLPAIDNKITNNDIENYLLNKLYQNVSGEPRRYADNTLDVLNDYKKNSKKDNL